MQKPLYSLLLINTLLKADGFYNSQSFQGFTGIINTPNAEILKEGKVALQISNQVDTQGTRNNRDKYTADQYMINFGILPNFEFGGRLSNIEVKDTKKFPRKWVMRDLSASFKYQIPFYHKYLPKVAIGIQDLGGQADNYDAKYIVATKEYTFLRGSIGYSVDSDRMDGLFGGIEAKATDWATLLAEYDSKETHLGVRLNVPDSFSNYFDLSFLAKANLDDDKQRFAFALNLKIEIGDNHHSKKVIKNHYQEVETSVPQTPTSVAKATLPIKLKDALVNFGFENIDIGSHGNTIYVAYENNILDHNELDALGVILGYLVKLDVPYKRFEIVIKKSNQKVKQVSGDLKAYKNVIKNMSPFSLRDFKNSIKVDAVSNNKQTTLSVKGANSSYLKTRLEIYPGLKTFIGTELGVLDYLLSARTYLHWNLYEGFDLGILYDFPLLHSDDLNKDHGGFKQYNQDGNELKSILLHRSDVFGNFVNILSIGTHGKNWAGFESLTYTNGNHTLSAKYGYLQQRDKEYWRVKAETRELYLGTYSYYSDKFDTIAEYTYGQFYNQDYGFEVKAKRYFGDVAIGLLYQQTTQKYAGISVEIPLTPRRVADSWFQIKGKNDFSYQVRTTVDDDDGRNTLEPGGVIRAGREFDIERRFLNKNRLSSDYIKKHILRLRDTYFVYVSLN